MKKLLQKKYLGFGFLIFSILGLCLVFASKAKEDDKSITKTPLPNINKSESTTILPTEPLPPAVDSTSVAETLQKKENYVEKYLQQLTDKKEITKLLEVFFTNLDDKALQRIADRSQLPIDQNLALREQVLAELNKQILENLQTAMKENLTEDDMQHLSELKENKLWIQMEEKTLYAATNVEEVYKFNFDPNKYPKDRLEKLNNAILESGDIESANMLMESAGLEVGNFQKMMQEGLVRQMVYLTHDLDESSLQEYLKFYIDPAVIKEKKVALDVFKSSIFEALQTEQ